MPILVVDDEPDILETVGEMLYDAGCSVFVAADGEEALAILAALSIRLLLADVRMPMMNGVELARQALAVRPDLTVVLMSGYPTDAALNFPLLRKPFRLCQLLAVAQLPASADSSSIEDRLALPLW
jgi:CheY-like chemotaxis protein